MEERLEVSQFQMSLTVNVLWSNEVLASYSRKNFTVIFTRGFFLTFLGNYTLAESSPHIVIFDAYLYASEG